MKYMGSKSRIAKEIVPIIQSYIEKNNINLYVEPFVGGANIIDKIICERKIGFDKQNYLIELLKNVEKVEHMPDFIEKEEYDKVRTSYYKENKEYEDWYIGAVGFLSSYNGRFFDGGYSGRVYTKIGKERNYYLEAKNNLLNQKELLRICEFYTADYREIKISNAVIYCDPPYKNTKQYGINRNFDNEEFWEWCRTMATNNVILCSEYSAPKDFICIWEQPVTRTIDNTKRIKTIERLFTI